MKILTIDMKQGRSVKAPDWTTRLRHNYMFVASILFLGSLILFAVSCCLGFYPENGGSLYFLFNSCCFLRSIGYP
jgi:hypothetical protein